MLASAGNVYTDGRAYVGDAYYYAEKHSHNNIGQRYLNNIAATLDGMVRRSDKGSRQVLRRNGTSLDILALLQDAVGWKNAIATFINELRSATEVQTRSKALEVQPP